MATKLIIVLLSALVVVNSKQLAKRDRACEDLADALVDLQEVAATLHEQVAAQINQVFIGFQMQFGVDASDRSQLSNFVCQFEGLTSVEDLANVFGIPAQYIRPSIQEAKTQWQLIGGAAGLRRLADPVLRAADAFERMGLLNLA